jgi:hypothetical protein
VDAHYSFWVPFAGKNLSALGAAGGPLHPVTNRPSTGEAKFKNPIFRFYKIAGVC